jgi:FRG domain-containing protein
MSQQDVNRPWVAKASVMTAHEFVDLLSPVSGVFASERGLPHQLLFRGVGDVLHSLTPAAFRSSARLFLPPHTAVGPGGTNRQQIERELKTLIAFIKAVDRQGHPIPEDTQHLRAELKSLEEDLSFPSKTTIKEWPPSSLLSALALAQHYGVPTRLLDWSLDPYVSAYFAAANAATKISEKGHLAVWAVATHLFVVNEILVGDKTAVARLPVQHVTTPWAGNANARAQKAVFLAYRQFDIDPDADFEIRPYDDLLVGGLASGFEKGPNLFCLTLPKSEAPALLGLLAFQGYDGATIFPGLDGAVKSIMESYLWPSEFGPNPRTARADQIVSTWMTENLNS